MRDVEEGRTCEPPCILLSITHHCPHWSWVNYTQRYARCLHSWVSLEAKLQGLIMQWHTPHIPPIIPILLDMPLYIVTYPCTLLYILVYDNAILSHLVSCLCHYTYHYPHVLNGRRGTPPTPQCKPTSCSIPPWVSVLLCRKLLHIA